MIHCERCKKESNTVMMRTRSKERPARKICLSCVEDLEAQGKTPDDWWQSEDRKKGKKP